MGSSGAEKYYFTPQVLQFESSSKCNTDCESYCIGPSSCLLARARTGRQSHSKFTRACLDTGNHVTWRCPLGYILATLTERVPNRPLIRPSWVPPGTSKSRVLALQHSSQQSASYFPGLLLPDRMHPNHKQVQGVLSSKYS